MSLWPASEVRVRQCRVSVECGARLRVRVRGFSAQIVLRPRVRVRGIVLMNRVKGQWVSAQAQGGGRVAGHQAQS